MSKLLNAPTRIEWVVTAWQQQNNVGCRVCDTEEEAAAWVRHFHAQGWKVKVTRKIMVMQ